MGPAVSGTEALLSWYFFAHVFGGVTVRSNVAVAPPAAGGGQNDTDAVTLTKAPAVGIA
jgi:hypothetical protein